VIIFLASLALIVMLWLFFERTLYGKALRATAVNRLGARLMGISSTAPAGCRSRWRPSSARCRAC
jgi:branched-chain amino acid transport system permease protein